ncbi:hypothetical protein CARUB_v10024288mg [Capsella rubella]|uniref:Uncharacterized protein n=1 Tax=Capsella rubella TaxID=81985 RepID=R0FYJ0_9BRAS|nr:uncharacterized protein LOC17888716 [Capsella rubella]XP_006295205.1 uncharacterized protein LOC17888716 [Capsella rubella]EOA28102.1 hypothetical protein CARUB_v10024288mg [Capsella rubella]EOA28103.1 hypothetical protein CARUB_v10024288mg [Capsella rubella]
MRRGRGKGRKQNVSAREDCGSGEEEKIPAYRRRGRPQKPMKDDFKEEAEEMVEKIEDEEEEEDIDDGSVTSKDLKKEKRRKVSIGSSADLNEEDNGLGSKSSTDDSAKSTSIGFRQNGSRRKSKPRRAAEAVVECNGF